MVTLKIEGLFELPPIVVEDTLDFMAPTRIVGVEFGEPVSTLTMYTSPLWLVVVDGDKTLVAYRKDGVKPHLSGVVGKMTFTIDEWKQTLLWLAAQQLSKASDSLAKKLAEMEAREKKLIAQLDNTKALLRYMFDASRQEGLRSITLFQSQAWFDHKPEVTLAEEDWYNTDKATIVPRYMEGDLNEESALYLMETGNRVDLVRAVDAYRAANNPQGQE